MATSPGPEALRLHPNRENSDEGSIMIEFAPLTIGEGLKATAAFWRTGDDVIVSVCASDKDSRPNYYRLDIQKRAFIDELPVKPSKSGISKLLQTIADSHN